MSDENTPATVVATPHISQLRQHLMDTLADLRNRDKPMEPDRARAIAQVAGVIVDTARVEVDYLRATKQARAGFLEEPPQITSDSRGAGIPTPNNPFPRVTRHLVQDDEG